MTGVAILVPMLGRPHRVAPLLHSIRTSNPDPYRVLFLLSPQDFLVREAVEAERGEWLEVQYRGHGDYARKINAGYQATTEPWLFTGADDLRFHPNWLAHALRHATGTVGVIGTNDLCNKRTVRGEHSTHSLVARWYADLGTIDQPEAIYHEGYPHEYVDDELVATAQHRGAWAMARDSIVEHLHPMVGKAPMDDLYAQQANRMRAGRRVYERRRALWTT